MVELNIYITRVKLLNLKVHILRVTWLRLRVDNAMVLNLPSLNPLDAKLISAKLL